MNTAPATPVRRRDAVRTKEAILRAAQTTFSTHGYAQAGLREIAARAGVNAALVARYYGSKEALFEAALSDALNLDQLLETSPESFGRHTAEILTVLPGAMDPTSMMVLAIADAGTRAIVVKLLEERVIDVLARWLGSSKARSRAAQITVLCTGFVTYRRLLPLPETAEPSASEWLAKALQDIVDS